MGEAKRYENFIGGGEGTEFEWDIFGAVDTNNPEYQKELAKVTKPNGFVFFPDAMKLVKKFQPGDPENPERGFARDLRIEIIDQLGLVEEKDMDRVKFYTAVGSLERTPLDHWHSIDGFFEIEMENGPPIIITLDATTIDTEEKIKRGQKVTADIVVGEKWLNLADEKGLPEKTAQLAKEIVNIFRAKKEEINKRAEETGGKYSPPNAAK